MLKNVSRIEKLVLAFVAIVTLSGFALSYINHDLFKQYLVVEDGFTEWMTVLALLVGMVVCFRRVWLLRGDSGRFLFC